jgi:hypothetical protein
LDTKDEHVVNISLIEGTEWNTEAMGYVTIAHIKRKYYVVRKMKQQQHKHEMQCIHSNVCRFRFVSDPPCDGKNAHDGEICSSFSIAIVEPSNNDQLILSTKKRIRQLFLDDSKCELCEKVFAEDGYDGNNEGCEKGLCIECAIHKSLVEFSNAITRSVAKESEQRIEDAIDELQRRIDNPVSKPFEPHSHDCDIVNAAYASAISLLREGDNTDKIYKCVVPKGECNQYKKQGNKITYACIGCGSLKLRGERK